MCARGPVQRDLYDPRNPRKAYVCPEKFLQYRITFFTLRP